MFNQLKECIEKGEKKEQFEQFLRKADEKVYKERDAEYGGTLLHWACAYDRVEIVWLLSQYYRQVFSMSPPDATPLCWAAHNGRSNTVSYLCLRQNRDFFGIDLNQIEIALGNALQQNNQDVARILVSIDVIGTNFARKLTIQHGFKQAGRLPKAHPEIKYQTYRSFAKERERQLLRQIATQLFFGIRNDPIYPETLCKLTEIQVMHIVFGVNDHLFIAANETTVTKHWLKFISDKDSFDLMLVKPHKTLCADKNEGKIRTKRFATKLRKRVYTENSDFFNKGKGDKDNKHAFQVAQILRGGHFRAELLSLDYIGGQLTQNSKTDIERCLGREKSIYFVKNGICSDKGIHAEEFFVDIARHAKALAIQFNIKVYSCVGGKKRPCITCSGSMEGVIDNYGNRPGRFWLHCMQQQSDFAKIRTINLLRTSNIHITKSKSGKNAPDYDSGSDSDENNEENDIIPGISGLTISDRTTNHQLAFPSMIGTGSIAKLATTGKAALMPQTTTSASKTAFYNRSQHEQVFFAAYQLPVLATSSAGLFGSQSAAAASSAAGSNASLLSASSILVSYQHSRQKLLYKEDQKKENIKETKEIPSKEIDSIAAAVTMGALSLNDLPDGWRTALEQRQQQQAVKMSINELTESFKPI